jgi:hypothetical protein
LGEKPPIIDLLKTLGLFDEKNILSVLPAFQVDPKPPVAAAGLAY